MMLTTNRLTDAEITEPASLDGGLPEHQDALQGAGGSGNGADAAQRQGVLSVALALAEAIGAAQPLTVSIGVASNAQTHELEALLHAADLALYRAKAEGRNRVVRFAA